MASDSSTELCSSPLRDEEGEDATRTSPFFLKLPESLSRDRHSRDVLLPGLIALGPHNANNRIESYRLPRIANGVRRQLDLPEYDQLCSQFSTLKLRIQACYGTGFEIDSVNSDRIMLVDALFLLGLLLNISAQVENSVSIELPSDASFQWLDMNREMLVKDVVKIDNQIPLLVVQWILAQSLTTEVELPLLLHHFCQTISPFALVSRNSIYDIHGIKDESHHLLHFMYLSILILPGRFRVMFVSDPGEYEDHEYPLTLTFFQNWFSRLEFVIGFILDARELMGLIQTLLQLMGMLQNHYFAHKTTSSNVIPSASQLHKLAVNFQPIDDGILGVRFTSHFAPRQDHFDPRELTENQMPPQFFLPVMNINAFTETVLENLLVLEAMANINPPVYSLYVDLMKALIRTPEDVQILKENGIIIMTSHFGNDDEQVVKLFVGLGSSISNLKNPDLEPITTFDFQRINEFEEVYKGMVEEINQYYDCFWKVKATKVFKMLVNVVKMLAIPFTLLQILKLVKEMVIKFIGDDEPNYGHLPPT